MAIQWTGAITIAASAAAMAALAHSGASGVVLERMNGMTAMRDVVAELAPMMQGTVPYDASIVSEGANVIAGHAGEAMLSLFPEGSLEGVNYAKPEIWTEWQVFAALAEELEVYANALSDAAPNGLQPATPTLGDTAQMDHSAMAMPTAAPTEREFTVAELMGYSDTTELVTTSRGITSTSAASGDLATLAADDLLARVGATCSSCHARFRTGRN